MSQKQSVSGQAHGSAKEYIIGLFLSIVLTLIPFGLVVYSDISGSIIMYIILFCAISQLLVQAVFFLHMNGNSSQVWNTSSAIYILAMLLVLIIGTIWIFKHLSDNTMLGH